MCLFRAGRRAAVEPLTRAALERIVLDEAHHQRLGWDALTALWPDLDQKRREQLQLESSSGLAAMEQTIAVPALRRLEAGHPFDPAHAALGVLARKPGGTPSIGRWRVCSFLASTYWGST